jgi:uncharacterized protein (DUF849 family)
VTVLLKAALNGARSRGEHVSLPVTAVELAADARACVAAGAGAIHLHPRDGDGAEALSADVVDAVVRTVRAAVPSVPVGVSTGAWIEPDPERRAALIAGWTEPDMASVNVHEDGALDVIDALIAAGIGVEAGVWSVADADALTRSGRSHLVLRVLVEIVRPTEDPCGETGRILEAVDASGSRAPVLVHGEGAAAWPVIRFAVANRFDTRIGLEDVLTLPDGEPARSNAELIRHAARIGAGGAAI